MGGVEDVLARAATDESFRARLAQDPRRALADWDLSPDDVRRIVDTVDARQPAPGVASLFDGPAVPFEAERRSDDDAD